VAVLGIATDGAVVTERDAVLSDTLRGISSTLHDDINNDLQLVLRYAEMLKSQQAGEPGGEYCDILIESTKAAIGLIQMARTVGTAMVHTGDATEPIQFEAVIEASIKRPKVRFRRRRSLSRVISPQQLCGGTSCWGR